MTGEERAAVQGAGVVRGALTRWVEPDTVWAVLEREHPAIVRSDRAPARFGGTTFIGVPADPDDVIVCDPDGRLRSGRGIGAPTADPLDAVCAALRERLPPAASPHLGWWGWFGYELGRVAQRIDAPMSDQPLAAFLLARRGVVFDHVAGEVAVIALEGDHDWAERTARRLEAAEPPPAEPVRSATAEWRLDRAAYLDRIGACLAAIGRGDAYQLCLTNRVTVRSDGPIDPLAIARALRPVASGEYAGLLRVDGWTLVSGSPERFLRVDADGRATTKPIKGTRPRSVRADEDRRFAAALLTDEKERAENLMIVDLMRNDLSRASRPGSVSVPRLLEVESTPSVHHLVSTVASVLEGDALSAVPALLPAGSMTGAPKRSAMQHLARLEDGPRGIYSGAWGRVGADGSLDLGVVIRSAVLRGDTATVGTGGGITALSDPAAEWEEVLLKAAPTLAALGVRGR